MEWVRAKTQPTLSGFYVVKLRFFKKPEVRRFFGKRWHDYVQVTHWLGPLPEPPREDADKKVG